MRARARRAPETSWNGDWELRRARPRHLVGWHRRSLLGVVRFGGIALAARVKLPSLRAVDRRGVLAELRRAVAAGQQPNSSAADNVAEPRHDPRHRPLDRRAPGGSGRGRGSRREDRAVPVPSSDRSLRRHSTPLAPQGARRSRSCRAPGALIAGRPSYSTTRAPASSLITSASAGSRSRASRATRSVAPQPGRGGRRERGLP